MVNYNSYFLGILFYIVPYVTNAQENHYFQSLYKTINTNIEAERFSENFSLITSEVQKQAFKDMTCYERGKIYHKIGVSHYMTYQEAEAITYYTKALDAWKRCQNVPLVENANTQYNLGLCHQFMQDYERAKTYLDAALATFETAPNYSKEKLAHKYHGIGLFYEQINDLFRADLYYANAINIFKEKNAILECLDVLNNTVVLYMNFKMYEEAMTYADQALGLIQQHDTLEIGEDQAPIYLNIATINQELGNTQEALVLADKALSLINKKEKPLEYAIGLEIKAFCAIDQGAFQRAEQLMKTVLQQRLEAYQGGSGLSLIALSYENLSELYLRKGDLDQANVQLQNGLKRLIPVANFKDNDIPAVRETVSLDDGLFLRLLDMKTRILQASFEKTQDLRFLDKSLVVQHKIDSVINRSLLSFQFEQSKLDLLNLRMQHYSDAIKEAFRLYELTGEDHYMEQAYGFSAHTKAIVLQQELNRIKALQNTQSSKVQEQEKALRTEMTQLQTQLFEAEGHAQEALLKDYLATQNRLDAFLKRMETDTPDYFNSRYAFLNIPKVKAIQDMLPQDVALVEYFVAKEQLYAFWISKNHFFTERVPWDLNQKTAVDSFITQCSDPSIIPNEAISKQLYNTLLKNGLTKLGASVSRLCIIPDGVLHSVSFEALRTDSGFLLEDYAVSVSYAAALLKRQDSDRIPKQGYVGFATTYSTALNDKLRSGKRLFGENGLATLSLANREVETVAEVLGGGRTFLNEAANLDNFFEYAKDASIIHLSLHGLVDFNDPFRSCILFDDNADNYILSPQDLYQQKLTADLVLLSACHSASGKIYRGEGVQGMSKAFLLNGARKTMSSLWNASETSAMRITQSFIENLETGTPADRSLQEAKISYFKNVPPSQRHPYYWANFVLIGDLDQDVATRNNGGLLLITIMLIAIVLFILFSKKINKS